MLLDPRKSELYRRLQEEEHFHTMNALKCALIVAIAQNGLEVNVEHPFTLASGEISPFYFDLKKVMMMPEANALTAKLILERIKDSNINCIGGMESGALPITAGIFLEAERSGLAMNWLSVLKTMDERGQWLDGYFNPGDSVGVIEDVASTGAAALQACERITGSGLKVVRVFSVLNRGEGVKERIESLGIQYDCLLSHHDFEALLPVMN